MTNIAVERLAELLLLAQVRLHVHNISLYRATHTSCQDQPVPTAAGSSPAGTTMLGVTRMQALYEVPVYDE